MTETWDPVLSAVLSLLITLDPDAAPRPAPALRAEAPRTMQHEDPVLQRALLVLGQPVSPIVVLDPNQIRAVYAGAARAGLPPAGLIAFRAPGDASDANIYVNRESPVYRSAARKPTALAL